MKKRLNITFFGICFLAAILAEAYCLTALKGELFSTAGIGIVVLVNGYLFIDSIGSSIKLHMDYVKFYTDNMIKEETERFQERYNEIVNLQKATYTATKKNTVIISEQFKDILLRFEAEDNIHLKELQRIIELQKKSMEGQKNALNMELHYIKEYTKQLIGAIHEVGDKSELTTQLSGVIKLLEDNNKLLSSGIVTLDVMKQIKDYDQAGETTGKFKTDKINDNYIKDDYVKDDYIKDDYVKDDYIKDDYIKDNYIKEDYVKDDYVKDDYVKDDHIKNDYMKDDYIDDSNNEDYKEAKSNYEEDSYKENGYKEDEFIEDYYKQDNNKKEGFSIGDSNHRAEDIKPYNTRDEYEKIRAISEQDNLEQNILGLQNPVEERADQGNTKVEIAGQQAATGDTYDGLSEFDNKEDTEKPAESTVTVKPLYGDPNKSLSADEIAALFASIGQ